MDNLNIPIDLIKKGQWAEIRMIRSRLLRESDYTQFPDSPLTSESKAAFAEYRKILRDIPDTYSDPLEVVWPLKPTV